MSRIPSTTTEGRSSRCECQLAFDAAFARFYEGFGRGAPSVFIQWVVSFEKAFVNLMELSLSVSNLPCYESIESP